jgi:hypothetical protein
MTRTEAALQYFDGGCDCGKALLRAYEPVLALDKSTRAHYRTPCSQLPGSPSKLCELVSGSLAVLSHVGSPRGEGAGPDLAQRFKDRFMSNHEGLECKKLLGLDLTELGDLSKAIDSDAIDHVCRELVVQACGILDELIGDVPAPSAE